MIMSPGVLKTGVAAVALIIRSSESASDRELGNLVLAGLILNAVVGAQPRTKDVQ